jgi:hypothetical protein
VAERAHTHVWGFRALGRSDVLGQCQRQIVPKAPTPPLVRVSACLPCSPRTPGSSRNTTSELHLTDSAGGKTQKHLVPLVAARRPFGEGRSSGLGDRQCEHEYRNSSITRSDSRFPLAVVRPTDHIQCKTMCAVQSDLPLAHSLSPYRCPSPRSLVYGSGSGLDSGFGTAGQGENTLLGMSRAHPSDNQL